MKRFQIGRRFAAFLSLVVLMAAGAQPLPGQAAAGQNPPPEAPPASGGGLSEGAGPTYQELRILPPAPGVRSSRTLVLRAEALDPRGRWMPVTPQWQAAEGATVNGLGHFMAVEPGEYQVTATLGELKATTRVTVWGAPERLVLEAPTHMVGDGRTPVPVVVRAIDQRGTVVADFAGQVRLSTLPAGRIWPQGTPEPAFNLESVQAAVAGEARFFLVVPGTLVERSITLTAWADRNQDGRFALPQDLTARRSVEVAGELRPQVRAWTGTRFLPADGTPTPVQVALADAAGRPMIVDGLVAEVQVSGAAVAAPTRLPLAAGVGEFTLQAHAPGMVQVRVSVPGGEAAVLDLEARVPGPARGVRLFPADAGTLQAALAGPERPPVPVAGTDPWEGMRVGVQVVDAAGVPVGSPLDRPVRIGAEVGAWAESEMDPATGAGSGAGAAAGVATGAMAQIRLNGRPLTPDAPHATATIPARQSTAYLQLHAAAFSGTLPLVAHLEGADPDVVAPGRLDVQVVGGPPVGVRLTGAEVLTVYEGVNLATAVVTVLDRFGNPSPTDGVRVQLAVEGSGIEATISGSEQPGVEYSQGSTARFSLHLQGRAGRRVLLRVVEASYDRLPLAVDPATATLSLMAAPPRLITGVQILASGRPVTRRTAGDEVTLLVQVTDPEGRPVQDADTAQALRVRYSSRMAQALSGTRFSYDPNAGGYVAGPFRLTGAGVATFTVTYTGGSQRQTAGAQVSVRAGAAAAIRVREARSGRLTVTNQQLAGPYTLEATDAYGNPAPFNTTVTIPLAYTGPDGGTLEVRTLPSGIATQSLTLRQESRFYLITTRAGTYELQFHLPEGEGYTLRVTARD